MPIRAMVLAAGIGTRLRPLTDALPKPMAPLNGRPLLAYIVDWLRRYDVTDLVINLHHRPEAITSYFGDGSAFGVRIDYSHEPELLGTAGAVAACRHFFSEAPLLVVYGDTLSPCNLADLNRAHQQRRGLATLTACWKNDVSDSGMLVLKPNGRILDFVEKPAPEAVVSHWINAGAFIAEPRLFDYIPAGHPSDFSRDVFPSALQSGERLFAYKMNETIGTADTPEALKRLDALVRQGSRQLLRDP